MVKVYSVSVSWKCGPLCDQPLAVVFGSPLGPVPTHPNNIRVRGAWVWLSDRVASLSTAENCCYFESALIRFCVCFLFPSPVSLPLSFWGKYRKPVLVGWLPLVFLDCILSPSDNKSYFYLYCLIIIHTLHHEYYMCGREVLSIASEIKGWSWCVVQAASRCGAVGERWEVSHSLLSCPAS